MAKAYFIGGTSRVGKTTLAHRFLAQKPMLATSTDAIRYMLRRVLSEESHPDLYLFGARVLDISNNPDYFRNSIDKMIEMQNNESSIVWKSVSDFVESNLKDGCDVLIEGVAILPEYLEQINYDYSAVFLGNESEGHKEFVLHSAHTNEYGWMHNLEDETIAAFSQFSASFSSYIKQEAQKYNQPYIEIRDDESSSDIDTALSTLAKR